MYNNILLPVDLSNDNTQKKAILAALDLAKSHNAVLHIMTVVPNFGMSIVSSYFAEGHAEKMMEDAKTALQSIIDSSINDAVKTKKIVGYGTIYSEIVDYANHNKIDLVIMASHRSELKDYLLGPNAAKVSRHAKCSAMIVRD